MNGWFPLEYMAHLDRNTLPNLLAPNRRVYDRIMTVRSRRRTSALGLERLLEVRIHLTLFLMGSCFDILTIRGQTSGLDMRIDSFRDSTRAESLSRPTTRSRTAPRHI